MGEIAVHKYNIQYNNRHDVKVVISFKFTKRHIVNKKGLFCITVKVFYLFIFLITLHILQLSGFRFFNEINQYTII